MEFFLLFIEIEGCWTAFFACVSFLFSCRTRNVLGTSRERREPSGTPGTATRERDWVRDWERARGAQSRTGSTLGTPLAAILSRLAFRLLFLSVFFSVWRSFASELMTMITKAKRKVTTTLQSESKPEK